MKKKKRRKITKRKANGEEDIIFRRTSQQASLRNISSLLKYCPIIECQSVAFKWLFTDWLMTNGFCVVAFNVSQSSIFEEDLKKC